MKELGANKSLLSWLLQMGLIQHCSRFLRKISVSKNLNHVSRDLQIMAGGPESLRRLGTWWAISMSCIVRFFPPI